MHDIFDCAQIEKLKKKKQKEKEKEKAKSKKESKCFYMITSVFSRRYESYMM